MTPPDLPPLDIADAKAWRAETARGDRLWIDLSLGAWRPRRAAFDLAAGLGATLRPAPAPPVIDLSSGGAWQAALIGRGIDEEAAGRTAWRRAAEDLADLAPHLARTASEVVVLPPRFGQAWREADVAFLILLSERLGGRVRATALAPDAAPPERPQLADLFPGLIPAALAQALGVEGEGAASTPGGWLVDPLRRADPRTTHKALFGRLAAASDDPWLRAYCAMFGHNLYVEAAPLLEAAASAHAAGASDLALDLLARAETCGKTPLDRALAVARAQGFRIASHRFAEAAQVPTPPNAPAPIADYVAAMRAWGQVMTGRAEDAAQTLEPLADKPETSDAETAYDLYMLNIAALGRLRRGDGMGAEVLERRIEARLAQRVPGEAQLAYVNQLNLSRLRRRAGDPNEARTLHRRAFATVWGVMDPWEVFHFEVLEALAAEALGEAAEPFWLKAALAWSAAPLKLAVPDRALRALLGPSASADTPGVLAKVSATLAERLGEDGATGPEVTLLAPDDQVLAVADLGFCVLGRAAPARPTRDPLTGALAAALGRAGLIAGDERLVIDLGRGLGFETGRSGREALGRRSKAPERASAFHAQLNPAVATTEGNEDIQVRWARRLAPARFSGPEAALIRRAAAGRAPLDAATLAMAETLESRRVLRIEPEEDGCIEDGPRSRFVAICETA